MARGGVRYLILIVFIIQVSEGLIQAQVPQKFSYQELVRDATNVILLNQTIGMRVSILQGSPAGAAVYGERQTPTTNANGLASIEVGTGTPLSGNFSTISWSAGPYFVKTEIDPAGGTAYSLTNTTQLLSVPYALYAKTLNYNNLSNKPVTDGTETKIISGTNITVGGVGSTATPYVVNFVTHSVTQAERNAILTPYTGQLVWCNNCGPSGELQIFNGTTWINMCGAAAAPVLPTVTTTSVSAITGSTATSGGEVTSDGGGTITARGVCWSTSANPTTANSLTSDGTGTGSFSSAISGLSPLTTYYVRAYATNAAGTSYGNQVSFTTAAALPTLTTTAVSSITLSTGSSGGNITSNGGAAVTARGVCWSVYPNPTIADPKTTDGSGSGSFTSSITGLPHLTTLYVRAWATNSAGTAYGNEVTFTTLNLAAGDLYQGGIVAYILLPTDPGYVAGQTQGFIANASDLTIGAQWGCSGVDIGGAVTAERTAIGGGLDNTMEIVSNCLSVGIAAEICNSLILNGYTDWYLPSIDELGKLYANRVAIGGFVATSYWSSSEYTASPTNRAWVWSFATTFPNSQLKTNNARVRAIRNITKIGDIGQGGRIAYILRPGDPGYVPGEFHGLAVSTADLGGGVTWGCSGILITGADGTAIGTGNQNTTDILGGCGTPNIAADLCADYVLGLYSDWYLPSRDELDKIYQNRALLGGFTANYYWTSTEDSATNAFSQSFVTGAQVSNSKATATYRVRAVRAF
jgi:hypothetical protein